LLQLRDAPSSISGVSDQVLATADRPARERDPLVTLGRGLNLLEVLAAAPSTRGLDHATLAKRAGFQRSTLYRYLALLQRSGYVEEIGSTGRYRLGPRILYLAATMHQREFSELARDCVPELARITGETAHATVYDHPYSVTVLIAENAAPVGPRVALGSRRPLHASASGKVFMAYGDPRRVSAYLAGKLEARTSRTITDPAALQRILCDVRNDGWEIDQGESYDGICGLAAPVFDFAGEIVATLSITVATDRLAAPRMRELVAPLVEKAVELSGRLGCPADRLVAVNERDGGSDGGRSR
jgi:DNA-binding IclR family transcriptional regulator